MSDILSQAEIEALLNSLSGEESPSSDAGTPATPHSTATTPGARRSTIAYEVYDFRRPDKFSKDQLRTLQMLHETFARISGSALSAYLRSTVNIELISLEQIPYEEYLRSINQSVFTIISLPPLTGQAVLEIEFSLIFTMLDRMLGGPGRSLNRSVLTEIELPLVRQVIERMFATLKSAWEGVVIVNPGVEGTETSAQFVQIAPPTDIVVSILFEVRIGSTRGAMSLCIPYMVLKPITAKLSAQKWFASSNRKQSPSSRRMLSEQVERSLVPCSVRLGRAKLSLHDFIKLRTGDVVRLDQKVEHDLTMCVSDRAKFRGKPALTGRKFVFNVSHPIE